MGAWLRYLILGLLIYLVLRWLRSLLKPPARRSKPEVEKSTPRPYGEGDVVDAKFTELPPEDKSGAAPQS